MNVNRIEKEPCKLFLKVLLGVIEIDFVVDLPVTANVDVAVACSQRVAGQQFFDVLEERLALQAKRK
jgi:hypothetical protein